MGGPLLSLIILIAGTAVSGLRCKCNMDSVVPCEGGTCTLPDSHRSLFNGVQKFPACGVLRKNGGDTKYFCVGRHEKLNRNCKASEMGDVCYCSNVSYCNKNLLLGEEANEEDEYDFLMPSNPQRLGRQDSHASFFKPNSGSKEVAEVATDIRRGRRPQIPTPEERRRQEEERRALAARQEAERARVEEARRRQEEARQRENQRRMEEYRRRLADRSTTTPAPLPRRVFTAPPHVYTANPRVYTAPPHLFTAPPRPASNTRVHPWPHTVPTARPRDPYRPPELGTEPPPTPAYRSTSPRPLRPPPPQRQPDYWARVDAARRRQAIAHGARYTTPPTPPPAVHRTQRLFNGAREQAPTRAPMRPWTPSPYHTHRPHPTRRRPSPTRRPIRRPSRGPEDPVLFEYTTPSRPTHAWQRRTTAESSPVPTTAVPSTMPPTTAWRTTQELTTQDPTTEARTRFQPRLNPLRPVQEAVAEEEEEWTETTEPNVSVSWSYYNVTTSPSPTLLTDPPSLIAHSAVTDFAPVKAVTTEVTPTYSEEPFLAEGVGSGGSVVAPFFGPLLLSILTAMLSL